MDSVESTIQRIIAERLALPVQPHELSADAPLFAPEFAGGLGLDSLASLEIIAAISDEYQLPLDDIEAADFSNITTLAEYLRQHGVASG